MIDRETARTIALAHLAELEREVGEELALEEGPTRRGPAGWLFYWNTRAYLERGEISHALAGNIPFLVDPDGNGVHELPPDADFDRYGEPA